MFKHSRAFTLLEILIVLVIIGVLIAVGLYKYASVEKASWDTQAQVALRSSSIAAAAIYNDENAYPASIVLVNKLTARHGEAGFTFFDMPQGPNKFLDDPRPVSHDYKDVLVEQIADADGVLDKQVTLCNQSKSTKWFCYRQHGESKLLSNHNEFTPIFVADGSRGYALSRGATLRMAYCYLPTTKLNEEDNCILTPCAANEYRLDNSSPCIANPNPNDVCPNINGVQDSIPSGLTIDSSTGHCVAGDNKGNPDPPDDPGPDPNVFGIHLISTPDNPNSQRTALFDWMITQGPAELVECKIDDEEFAPCTRPKTYDCLTGEEHTFVVRAIKGATAVSDTYTFDQISCYTIFTGGEHEFASMKSRFHFMPNSELPGVTGNFANPLGDPQGTFYSGVDTSILGPFANNDSNRAMKFNRSNSNSYVTVPDHPNIRMSGDWSMEIWLRPSCPVSIYEFQHQRTIMAKGVTSNNWGEYWLGYTCASSAATWNTLNFRYSGMLSGMKSDISFWSNTPLGVADDATWYQVAVVIDYDENDPQLDAATGKIYVNGVQVASQSILAALVPNSSDLTIGRDSPITTDNQRKYEGGMDELAFYDGALTQTEIQHHYECGAQTGVYTCQ